MKKIAAIILLLVCLTIGAACAEDLPFEYKIQAMPSSWPEQGDKVSFKIEIKNKTESELKFLPVHDSDKTSKSVSSFVSVKAGKKASKSIVHAITSSEEKSGTVNFVIHYLDQGEKKKESVSFSWPKEAAPEPIGTLGEYISDFISKREIGYDFNNWKYYYNEAIKMADAGLYGTIQYQAVLQMTIGATSNYQVNHEVMKDNGFINALASGDYYDYGLKAVEYLAKQYRKEDGVVSFNGRVGGIFESTDSQISWNIKDIKTLAKALDVTPELIKAWRDALEAYQTRLVYKYVSK